MRRLDFLARLRRVAVCAGAAWLAFACGSSPGAPGLPDTSAEGGIIHPGPGTFGSGDGGAGGGCSPSVGNFDVPGNACDDDGDGIVDNTPTCDNGLPVTSDANGFVKSLGLCQTASGPSDVRWGVVSAVYTAGYRSTNAPPEGQHGVLMSFGGTVRPREGASFGVLSSGWARAYDSPSVQEPFKGIKIPMQGGTPDAAPPGYPKTSPGCPLLDNATFDQAVLKITVKVPNNAKGFGFDFDFWSGEWPEYVCTPYNDTFIAYLTSKGFNNGAPENISFDTKNDTVSVNNGFFDRCTPNTQTGCAGGGVRIASCPGGSYELAGTGFDDPGTYCGSTSTGGGATGWLTSQAPVLAGEIITLEFMVWDTGDPNFDSSVILDHFQWIAGPVSTGTGRPK